MSSSKTKKAVHFPECGWKMDSGVLRCVNVVGMDGLVYSSRRNQVGHEEISRSQMMYSVRVEVDTIQDPPYIGKKPDESFLPVWKTEVLAAHVLIALVPNRLSDVIGRARRCDPVFDFDHPLGLDVLLRILRVLRSSRCQIKISRTCRGCTAFIGPWPVTIIGD